MHCIVFSLWEILLGKLKWDLIVEIFLSYLPCFSPLIVNRFCLCFRWRHPSYPNAKGRVTQVILMIMKRKRSESPLQINAPKNSQSSEERPDSRSHYPRLPAIKWDRWRERHWPAHKLLLPFHTPHLSSFLLVVQIQLGGHLILSWIWWCWFRLVLEKTPFSVIPHLAHTFASLLDRSEGPRVI